MVFEVPDLHLFTGSLQVIVFEGYSNPLNVCGYHGFVCIVWIVT